MPLSFWESLPVSCGRQCEFLTGSFHRFLLFTGATRVVRPLAAMRNRPVVCCEVRRARLARTFVSRTSVRGSALRNRDGERAHLRSYDVQVVCHRQQIQFFVLPLLPGGMTSEVGESVAFYSGSVILEFWTDVS